MRKAFVTYLGTADFLPGVLVLHQSLKNNKNDTQLVVLVTPAIPEEIISLLEINSFIIKPIEEIQNPNSIDEKDQRGTRYLYTKLRIFEMTEYDKIVFVDADMLICENIEALFSRPHMSAVIAGALFPGNSHWENLNSGLLVIEPSIDLFNDLISQINILPSPAKDDQDFINAYFHNCPAEDHLHLDHAFNIPAPYLDQYCMHCDFEFEYNHQSLHTKNISIIHYWGPLKPWDCEKIPEQGTLTKYQQSINLWWKYFDEMMHEE